MKDLEAMKKECYGIEGYFCFFLYSNFSFLLTCCLLLCPALRVKKQKLLEGVEEMKTLVRTSHNKAEEVITHAKEELALAKLIRRGADRDLMQAQKIIEDLSSRLATATEN